MDIKLASKNMKVTEELDAYTRREVDKLDRYLPHIRDISVDLAHEHTRRGVDLVSAQITVRHDRGAILRAEEKTTGDIKKAIDKAVDKMYRKIQRFKGKRDRKGKERFIATIGRTRPGRRHPGYGGIQRRICGAGRRVRSLA